MTKTLILLIDYALLPLVLLIIAKLVGIYLTAMLFSIEIGIVNTGQNIFRFSPVVSPEHINTISSYSDLFMFAVIAFGFSFLLITALRLHETHIDVSTINKLAKFNLLLLIQTSYQLYHAGAVWIVFLWLATGVILYNFLIGITFTWIFVLAFIFSLSATIILIKDLYSEINLSKKQFFSNHNVRY